MMTTSRAAMKKDRERDCTRDIVNSLDPLSVSDMKAWHKLPAEMKEGDGSDLLANLTTQVQGKFPKVSLDVPEPVAFVMVLATAFGPHESKQGTDPELTVLDKFEPGFGELWKEAKRVSGLVRKQWFMATVTARPEPGDKAKNVTLGIGMATDRNVARMRAIQSAEVRLQIITESMFKKTGKELF